jgi:hypothetical protein
LSFCEILQLFVILREKHKYIREFQVLRKAFIE